MAKVTGRQELQPQTEDEAVAIDWETFEKAMDYGYRKEGEAAYQNLAAEKKSTPVRVATADFLYAPEIDDLDVADYNGNAGDPIRVRAHDDVMVTEVRVAVLDDQNRVVEKGYARPEGDHWLYVATQAAPSGHVRIAVSASDLPGNRGEATVEKRL